MCRSTEKTFLSLTIYYRKLGLARAESRLLRLIKKVLAKKALSEADIVTTDGMHVIKYLYRLGLRSEKIRVVQFGVGTNKFRPKPKRKTRNLNVISLRSLYPLYNVETLIRAVPLVLRHEANTFFIVAGQGPEEGKLKRLAKQLEVSSQVLNQRKIENAVLSVPAEAGARFSQIRDVYSAIIVEVA